MRGSPSSSNDGGDNNYERRHVAGAGTGRGGGVNANSANDEYIESSHDGGDYDVLDSNAEDSNPSPMEEDDE